MLFLHAFVVTTCIVIGTRRGGIALGLFSALGLFVLHLFSGVALSAPPVNVLLTIFSIIITLSALESCGGLGLLIHLAGRLIQSKPSRINFYAPVTAYLLTMLSGTGHTVYSLLPVITEVSQKEKLRPELPLSMSVIASQQAITASPISAATVLLFSLLSPYNIQFIDILLISIPATFLGVLTMSLLVPLIKPTKLKNSTPTPSSHLTYTTADYPYAPLALSLFALGIVATVLVSIFSAYNTSSSPAHTIQITMLSVAAIIVLFGRVAMPAITKQSTFSAGIQAIIAIMGVSWLVDSVLTAHHDLLIGSCVSLIEAFPWTFALVAFALSILLFSQAVTVQVLFSAMLALGFPAPLLLAFFPSVNGYFFIPNYPTILAAIEFDYTGTTRIGSYLLNHSFMLPGLIATLFSIGYCSLFTYYYLGL